MTVVCLAWWQGGGSAPQSAGAALHSGSRRHCLVALAPTLLCGLCHMLCMQVATLTPSSMAHRRPLGSPRSGCWQLGLHCLHMCSSGALYNMLGRHDACNCCRGPHTPFLATPTLPITHSHPHHLTRGTLADTCSARASLLRGPLQATAVSPLRRDSALRITFSRARALLALDPSTSMQKKAAQLA